MFCGSHDITSRWHDRRNVTVTCRACRRVVRIEFDPPDQPGVRGRIDMLLDWDHNNRGSDVH
jgi:hypothetical protein